MTPFPPRASSNVGRLVKVGPWGRTETTDLLLDRQAGKQGSPQITAHACWRLLTVAPLSESKTNRWFDVMFEQGTADNMKARWLVRSEGRSRGQMCYGCCKQSTPATTRGEKHAVGGAAVPDAEEQNADIEQTKFRRLQ